ncbi:hypothetical protein [Roseivirga thermotolerans]|uniref:hypothetical protein n=1 Tax=Roseivirga thermotolerans TaxID=1758176 RepID=UPI00273F1ECA|nr:hypothetical protein [Roseivirga thermotolerans]
MKKLTNFILTLVLGITFSMFLPWWAVMLSGFISGAIVRLRKAAVFFVPFLAIALFWIVNAWLLSNPNDFILARKIATLFFLNGNVVLLLLITGLLGGIAAGVAAVFGNQCRLMMGKENR